MTMGQRAHHFQILTGDHEGLAGQRGPDQLDGLGRQRGDVAERVVADLAAFPVGAPQQVRDVLPVLVPAHNPGDMNSTRAFSHNGNVSILSFTGGGFTGYILSRLEGTKALQHNSFTLSTPG